MHLNKLNTSGERLRYARGLLGLTRTILQNEYNISHNTMSAWEIGRVQLTSKGALKLSKVFLELGLICHPEWLLCKSEDRPYFVQNSPVTDEIFSANVCVLREVEAFKTINPNPIVIMVPDDGMLPRYEPGDFIGGNLHKSDDIRKLVGNNCIIETTSGDIYFRRLIHGLNDGSFTLSCLNPNTSEAPILTNIKVASAAQVVWHRSTETLSP